MEATGLILVCVAIFSAQKANAASWSYDVCGSGQRQSPIDINVDGSGESELSTRTATITKYGNMNSMVTLSNNGKEIKLSFEAGRYTISGINLGANYTVAQGHFHWGSNNSRGSEHTLNGAAFPMELHIVTYHQEFATLTDAVASGHGDALAVLGFFFDISENDNSALQPVTNNIPHASGLTTILNNFSLEGLISDAFEGPYYRYKGSLTTPPCNEIVVWTVFEKTLSISQNQLDAFRKTGIVDNFRPVQPLNGRAVS